MYSKARVEKCWLAAFIVICKLGLAVGVGFVELMPVSKTVLTNHTTYDIRFFAEQ